MTSTVRKRVATLYSGESEIGGDKEAPLQTSPPQKGEAETAEIVREVAEGMFVSMCEGFEEEVITEENMEDAVQNLAETSINPTYSLVQTHAYALSAEAIKSSIRKLLHDVMKRSNSGEVTCELFCEAAIRFAEGNISLFDVLDSRAVLTKNAKKSDHGKPDHANLGTLLYNPGGTLLLMKRNVLKVVERRGSRWMWSFFSAKHFYWFLAVYFVPMMTLQVIVSSVSTALFNGTMLCLLIITVQTAINLEVVQSRIEYLSLFQYFNKEKGPIKMPALSKSDTAHYVTFVGGVVVGVVFLGFSHHSFVYYELLAIIAMIVSVMVLLQFDLYESPLLWLYILAKSPSWLVLGVEKMCSLVGYPPPQLLNWVKEPMTVLQFSELSFDVNVVTVFQVTFHVGVLMVLFAKYKGAFHNLGPHFLFFGWFVLCRHFISSSSATHLAIVSTAVLLLPFYTIAFFLSPFYFMYNYGLTPPFYYSLASIAIMGVIAAVVMLTYKHKREWWMNLSIEYVLLLCMTGCVFLVVFLSGWYASIYQAPGPLPTVSLDEYGEYCSPGNWVGGNSVQTQINCMHLQGRVLHSHADVESVSISSTLNGMADSLRFLPDSFEEALTCHFGESDPMCGDRTDMSTCIYTGCHFQYSLTHTFEIELRMPVGDESIKATMLVSHRYKDFVLKLRTRTSLQFDAVFVEGMGSSHLTLQAQSLGALGLENTRNLDKEKEMEVKKSLWSFFLQSIKNSVTIMLEILFGYAA